MNKTSLLILALSLGCEVDNKCATVLAEVKGGGDSGGGGGTSTTTSPVVDACGVAQCDPSVSEAKGKADCDDDDPKTADRCFAVAPECGALCVHVPVPCDHYDSAATQQAACDDGDPCTADRCGDLNSCAYSTVEDCKSCAEQACGAVGADCGFAWVDCDGDGAAEPHACGECAAPEACGGGAVPQQCGDLCLAEYGPQCAAAGLPSAWAFDAACDLVYQFGFDGFVAYCAGCSATPGCAQLDVGGVAVECCPS
jgi:hypothetical protein